MSEDVARCVLRNLLGTMFLAGFATLSFGGHSAALDWTVPPAYETAGASSAFKVLNSNKQLVELYSASYAVLIMEGGYRDSNWVAVTQSARDNERRLTEALETRGFHVLVWRDLDSKGLVSTLEDVRRNLGYIHDSRLFFYYFGHGTKIGEDGDDPPPETFLVPVDAPPASSEDFEKVSFDINRLVEFASAIKVRHAFFALEACRAGEVILSMGDTAAPNPPGYILAPTTLRSSREFLTAGNSDQDVPAQGRFSKVLVKGLSDADGVGGDNYVTGTEMMTYVVNHLPNLNPGQNPQQGELLEKHGDFIFGPANVSIKEKPVEEAYKTPATSQIDLPQDVAASMSIVLHVRAGDSLETARNVQALFAKYGVQTRAIVPVNSAQGPEKGIIRYYNNGDLRGATALRDILRTEVGQTTRIEQPDGVRGQHGLVELWL
ncbi:MAG: caspase family protein [Mesorhizobium sp.]|uniref:caspase family protein n=1 Tax=unclassified Mesorhizobium TaxID=325217 RepID=UPI000FCBAC86|nr:MULTISPECIES: caspase family protein [unclassified Mesorhizobium]RUW41360.1 caspase family protein [Mesorhizobium sp. M2A.F.Ca.ET.015.02.1.1]RVC97104.1 caspase family protein [Mesorhizobium sp. M2A.F.Ca.ET.017.03.2.1]RVD09115.1 caspase family protein [Mesorhizobium sp. M2A.F.Ca.ET.029.05.1.1]RWB37953.1 MAG: caspase family protein [Mesorhizobium sp.]RWB55285.1 MAG: caspase family protein [Mesorhizobium sp.]